MQIISGCTLTWQELFDEIRYFSSNNPNGVVIVDYFQLIKLIGNEDRIVELSILAGSIKRLAIELDIPIVLLSQVTKKLREQQNKHPNLEDLAECDALAQHADNVVFIYRDSYYEPSKDLEDDSTRKNTAEIIIAKQKNGPTGTINLLYQDNICKFKNVIKVDAF